MGPSVNDIDKRSVCGVVFVGECGHGFHKYCITQYLKENGNICQECRTMWKHVKTIDANVKIAVHQKAN